MSKYKQLIDQRRYLILKKYKTGLSPREIQRVKEIDEALDHIEMQKYGASVSRLEQVLELLEGD